METVVFSVSDFVAYLNQTLELAYTYVEVEGELSNFRVSKNKWVYFDIKDETATVRCFGTVYMLPGPLEDGMLVRIAGSPRLHPLYNFSFNVQSVVPVGHGALRKAADLLMAKLAAEGLFEESRKRPLPFPPERIALVTAGGSAAYADFVKIAAARWGGLQIVHYDVLVQGEQSASQVVRALEQINKSAELADVAVLVRGGGSAEDLAAFNDERVVRAVAGSRVPTLVAIGHEVDLSLAELAADRRASTPSNAAELLLPDKHAELSRTMASRRQLATVLVQTVATRRVTLRHSREQLTRQLTQVFAQAEQQLGFARSLLLAYRPLRPLDQGFALVLQKGAIVRSVAAVKPGDEIEVKLTDGEMLSQVKSIKKTMNTGGKNVETTN
jgi:exodeoxyribonuclease VII large subunit